MQIDPEPIAGAEIASEPKRCIGSDPSLSVNDLVDATWRDANRHGHVMLGYSKWEEEILKKDFAGVDWIDSLIHCDTFQ